MDAKAIETLSTSAVKDALAVSNFLDPFITDNDKEPSWDGHIYIYNNKNKKKENLKGRLPVQVKGTENNDFSKEEISYSISVADLTNYLYGGGAILFVVYVANVGLAKQIYYSALPPVKVRSILEKASGQKTKTIKLKKFPSLINEKERILFDCLEHCQRQASFSSAKLFSLEELEKEGVLESISVPFSITGSIDPKTALLTSEAYLYAQIKGSPIPQPLADIPQDLVINEKKTAQIVVGNKLFYDKVTINRDAKKTVTVFGESFSIKYENGNSIIKCKYHNSSKLRILVTDLDFILAYIKQRNFQYDGAKINFEVKKDTLSKFSVEEQTKRLHYFKKVVQMLDLLGCKKDVDIETLKKEEWKNINYLVTAFIDKREVSGLEENLPEILLLTIGNLKFLLYCQKVEGKKGTYKFFDFFKTQVNLFYESRQGEKLPISQYAILNADDLIEIDNIRFDVLLPSFQSVERHKETIVNANFFLLALLEAYDKSGGRPEIINAAKEFSEWIINENESSEELLSYNLRLLNKIQVIKRLRPLEKDESKDLYRIIETPKMEEDVLVGAYLLLDQQGAAEMHFEKMTKERQEEFKKFPIYHFWKKAKEVEEKKKQSISANNKI